jgi:hypothetical protein
MFRDYNSFQFLFYTLAEIILIGIKIIQKNAET